ncbi:MAG TPA: hypothetical protein DCQ04_01720 [Actinobacteria bacterium]|jgi:carbamoyl-phosphate synthase small subunit|nr:hypothetical protein [Actinomycetota bacterium]
MSRLLLVLIVVAVIALALWAMSRSWRRRVAAGANIPPLPSPAELAGDGAVTVSHATYLGTVTGEHWLDRVAAQGLGHRGPASVAVSSDGLMIDRVGTDVLQIPRHAISDVVLGRGLAGRVYGKEGVIIVSWTWGEVPLQTGIRIPDEQGRAAIFSALAQLPSGQQWGGSNRFETPIGEG